MHTILEWRNFLLSKGVFDDDVQNRLLAYINTLNINKMPIVFDLDHLCLLTGRSRQYMASVINASQKHWRSFRLQKRTHGYREISVPYPALIGVQRWIYSNILSRIPVSPYCHGFVRRKSILTNAKWHIGNPELLKIDLMDFFPSIHINRVIALFRQQGYNPKVSYYLASLCCLEGALPQGAPTSPCLSNLIARPLDYRLKTLARHKGLNYTRYADDITFSGDKIEHSLIDTIKGIIEDEGFRINEEKTRLYKNGNRRIVTGICITDTLSIPREYKRAIRQELHYIRHYGLISHIQKKKIKRTNYCESLLGRINYWLFVEPENTYAQQQRKFLMNLIREGYGNY